MRVRYGKRHTCSKCGKDARYYRVKARRCYECEHCGYQVFPMAGTAFEKSRTDLNKWFYAMHLFCMSRHGVSGKELQRQLGVTYKCAWRMAREIRLHMGMVDGDDSVGGPGKTVEADKMHFGGYDRMGQNDKTIVFGAAERDGKVITRILPDRKQAATHAAVVETVHPDSRLSTDTAHAFARLEGAGYEHVRVNHTKGEYVRGDVHTNSIEGFWSLFQRSVKGTHVWISRKHLAAYLGEFEFRWNLRKAPHRMMHRLLTEFAPPVR